MPGPDETKATVAAGFAAMAAHYDGSGVPFFARFADLLVAAAEPQPGWHVVDVGSGRGAVTFRLAEAVAPGGTVTAVDLSAAMVEALRIDLDAAGLPDVRTLVGDVEGLDLPTASADAVTASMVLFFLPDLHAGLHEIRRVLRPGGLLAFTVFGPSDPSWTSVYSALAARDPRTPQGADISRPRHPGLAGPDATAQTLDRAGFLGVRQQRLDVEIAFESLEQWHRWSRSCGLRAVWESIPQDARPAAVAAVDEQLRARQSATGRLAEVFAVDVVVATSPGAPAAERDGGPG